MRCLLSSKQSTVDAAHSGERHGECCEQGCVLQITQPPTVLSYEGAVKMRRPNQTSYEEETKVCCARGGRDGRDGLPGPPGPQGLAGALGGRGGRGQEREGKGGEGREAGVKGTSSITPGSFAVSCI